jgi:hypothetical protein
MCFTTVQLLKIFIIIIFIVIVIKHNCAVLPFFVTIGFALVESSSSDVVLVCRVCVFLGLLNMESRDSVRKKNIIKNV